MDTVAACRMPWIFTQRAPLSTTEFCSEAEKRGIPLNPSTLRELYRLGLLCPFIEIRSGRASGAPLPSAAVPEPRAAGTWQIELREARDTGRLFDLASSPFQPDLRFDSRGLKDPEYWWNGLLYSHDQLLALNAIRKQLESDLHRCHRADVVPAVHPPDDLVLERVRSFRRLAALLAVLESRYLPKLDPEHVFLTNAECDEWEAFRSWFDPVATLSETGWSTDEVRAAVENLLLLAHHHDVLGDWTDLIDRAPRRQWDRLKREPLVALDHRIAAEILMLFYEDLAAADACAPILPVVSRVRGPFAGRLSDREGTLDECLARLGVSPHPRVVLIIEGETEELMARRLVEMLELRADPDIMRVLVLRGVTKDITKVAAFASAPIVGARRAGSWDLIKPPTHLLIALDPDDGWSTPHEIEAQRKKIVDEIESVVRAPGGLLTPLPSRVTKLKLAHALLPVLEARTRIAMAGAGEAPQLARAISDAYRLAHSQPRGSYGLRSSDS